MTNFSADMQIVKDQLRIIRNFRNTPFARDYDTFSKIIASVRFAVEIEREERASAAPVVTVDMDVPASLDEIASSFGIASRAMQQRGATDAQIRYLAQMLVKEGVARRQINRITTLTKGEASKMIEDMKKRV